MSHDDAIACFCAGDVPPNRRTSHRHAGGVKGGCYRQTATRDATCKLDIDEWDCIFTHLRLCDRRVLSMTSWRQRRMDRNAWSAKRHVTLPSDRAECVGWDYLRYVAHLPVLRIHAGDEWADISETHALCSDHNSQLQDTRLRVCVAARAATEALRSRRSLHVCGVDLLETSMSRHASLLQGTPGNGAMIATITALSQHPKVRALMGLRAPLARREVFFITHEHLVGIFHSLEIADFAIGVLPWSWLRNDVREMFPWCGH